MVTALLKERSALFPLITRFASIAKVRNSSRLRIAQDDMLNFLLFSGKSHCIGSQYVKFGDSSETNDIYRLGAVSAVVLIIGLHGVK